MWDVATTFMHAKQCPWTLDIDAKRCRSPMNAGVAQYERIARLISTPSTRTKPLKTLYMDGD